MNREACLECGAKVWKLYEDVRQPPLEVGLCLCKDCQVLAIEDRIEELEDEISALRVKQQEEA